MFLFFFLFFFVFHKYNTVVCSTTFTKTLPFFSIMYFLCYWTEWVAGRDEKKGDRRKRKNTQKKQENTIKVECDKWDKSILFLLNEFNFLLLYFSFNLVPLCSLSLFLSCFLHLLLIIRIIYQTTITNDSKKKMMKNKKEEKIIQPPLKGSEAKRSNEK